MSDFHEAFAGALETGAADGLAPWLAGAPDGLAVYRNTSLKGAIDALGDAYPAVKRLVGDRFFAAMARAFHAAQPPGEASLSLYGEGFADHVAAWAPASALVYLPCVARLDRAWLEAHLAAAAPVLDSIEAEALGAAGLGAAAPGLHPSVRILASPHPAHTIWRANREDAVVERINLESGPQTALIWRPHGAVRHRVLSPAEAVFAGAAARGERFETAAMRVAEAFPGADPAPAFGRLLADGIFQGSSKR